MSRDEASVFSELFIRVSPTQEILLDLLPGFDRVGCDAGVKEEIDQDKLTLSSPLENLAVSGRDAEPPFVVNGVFEASAKHGLAPLFYGNLYHYIPLHPTVSQQ